ncbi:MAG TPA: ABC transporter permease [Candidatus Limnocylindrales bacterium]|nr:ABC transporter permease [Candidatus Limnocylindrales bacterium]
MTAPAISVRPAPGPSRLGVLARQAIAELKSNLRAPDFAAGVLALPIVLYLVFGAPRVTEPMPGGTVGAYLVVAFCIYGTLSVVLFGIGQAVADERGRGYVRLIRTTPLPTTAYLGAKLVLAAVLTLLSVVTVGIAGTLTGAGLPLDRWAAMAGVLVVGGLAIAPIGFLVGFMVRPSAAGAVSLLLLFPLSLASGVFMTVDSLPDVVRTISQYTPTYHLSELARDAAGFGVASDPLTHVAWIGAWSVAGTLATIAVYRRLVGRQFS